MFFLVFLGCVSSASVVPLGPTSYVVVINQVEVWDCRSETAPGVWEPVCVEADRRGRTPDMERREDAEREKERAEREARKAAEK